MCHQASSGAENQPTIATTKPSTTKRQGVCIELHGDNEPVGIFREILRSSGGKAMLGPAETLDGSFTDSPYAKVLQLAAKWRPKPRRMPRPRPEHSCSSVRQASRRAVAVGRSTASDSRQPAAVSSRPSG